MRLEAVAWRLNLDKAESFVERCNCCSTYFDFTPHTSSEGNIVLDNFWYQCDSTDILWFPLSAELVQVNISTLRLTDMMY